MDVIHFILNILGLEQLYFFQFRGHQLSFSLIASYRGNMIILISCVIVKGQVRIQNFSSEGCTSQKNGVTGDVNKF